MSCVRRPKEGARQTGWNINSLCARPGPALAYKRKIRATMAREVTAGNPAIKGRLFWNCRARLLLSRPGAWDSRTGPPKNKVAVSFRVAFTNKEE
jgi:hypothetical protein